LLTAKTAKKEFAFKNSQNAKLFDKIEFGPFQNRIELWTIYD
jgi:hypothetical protein